MKRDELDDLLDKKLAKFFGQLSDHFDERLDAELEPLRKNLNQVLTLLDADAKQRESDDQERAAIVAEQDRHGSWIAQLAKSTNTKLVPEQE